MKKNKIENLLGYLSFSLVVSYFFIENIFFVVTGIIVSLYLINITFINSLINSINKKFIFKKFSNDLSKNDKASKSDSINKKSNEEVSNLILAETIEELGYIPSIDKSN